MSVTEKIEEVRDTLKKLKHDQAFKKANKEREKMAEFLASIAKCRGKLEVSLTDFRREVRSNALYIREGSTSEADIALHEQMLYDAAIGYMLVRDAVLALKTVSSNDSIAYGYELLEVAVDQMNGKKKKLPSAYKVKKPKVKYDYIKSDELLAEKKQILESIFEDLKATGDIETCLSAAENNARIGLVGEKDANGVDKTSPEYLKSILGKASDKDGASTFDINDI